MSETVISKRRVFLAFLRNEFYGVSAYKASFWMSAVYTFLMMYSVGYVWRALYASGAGRMDVGLPAMISYAVLGVALEAVMHPHQGPQRYIAEQVRKGTIEMDMLKPVDFEFQMLAKNMGAMLVRLSTLVLPSLVCAYFLFGLQLPSPVALIGFLVSLALGIGVSFLLNYMLGLISMVTLNIRNINWAYNATLRFFSGQMVPLWIFPGALRAAGELLPFRCLYQVPMSIYISETAGWAMIVAMGVQAAWLAALFVCSRLLMRRVFQRLLIQGG